MSYIDKEPAEGAKDLLSSTEYEALSLTPEVKAERFTMCRHGYGLQMYSGHRNADGVMTKYEGKWHRDLKHGNGFAIFSDGSIFDGQFNKDEINGTGKFEWPQGHNYSG